MTTRAAADKRQSRKWPRRWMRLFMMLSFCLMIWAGITIWEQAVSMNQKHAELLELQEKLDAVRNMNKQYQTEVTRLHDDEYIEQMVRKDFGMIRPGDKIFDNPAE